MRHESAAPRDKAPAERFTGDVWLEMITSGDERPHAMVAHVHFSPGARNAWHAHHAGQVLHVTQGSAIVATADDAVIAGPGETVHAKPGEWHFHGALPDSLMSHLAIGEAGSGAEWGALVTDDEYRDALARATDSNQPPTRH